MKRSIELAKQASKPTGLFGKIIAFIMAIETRQFNNEGLDLLDIHLTDRILEVGFGHGHTIKRISRKLSEGSITGIDVSETMYRYASKVNERLITKGIANLRIADVEDIPFSQASFNKIICAHTIYFWKNHNLALQELNRVLELDGSLFLGFRFDEDAKNLFPSQIYNFKTPEDVSILLVDNGFKVESINVTHSKKSKTAWVHAIKI